MDNKEIYTEILSKAPNRRGMLKKLGISSAAVAVGAGLKISAQSATPTATDVVQFALNLEYLEAEFYSVATTGQMLEAKGIDLTGIGTPGPTTTAFGAVDFSDNLSFTGSVAQDIAADELAHVEVLRQALKSNGVTPIAKPAINLDALAGKGASLANEASFLTLARIFEDTGLSAYSGAALLLQNSPFLQTAARITAVEGAHSANIRLQVARLALASPQVDGADVVPPPSGSNFFSTNLANGLCATRTPGEVLFLAYGAASVNRGGFFPQGVNGNINMSTGQATAANLNT
jgi:Ferritin-like domain